METIYEIIYYPISFIFPDIILNDSFFSFIIDFTVFSLAWLILIVIAYLPILLAFRLTLRGVKKWF
jgi:hypothetical protein